jgi:hypothetical protein
LPARLGAPIRNQEIGDWKLNRINSARSILEITPDEEPEEQTRSAHHLKRFFSRKRSTFLKSLTGTAKK